LKKARVITKLTIEKINKFSSLIALNKDKISIFNTIAAKNEINITKKFLNIEASI
jgi:hypothetical protein